jgi:outer membrane protein assembly factor BamD (BamD/ComL family)
MRKAALSSSAVRLAALLVVVGAALGVLLLRRSGPAPTAVVGTPSATPSVPAPAPSEEEAQLLRGAEAALAAGDTDSAFSLLYEQATKFPRGPLAQAREVIHAQTLCRAGKLAEARAEAAAFVAQHPDSALSERARSICVPAP